MGPAAFYGFFSDCKQLTMTFGLSIHQQLCLLLHPQVFATICSSCGCFFTPSLPSPFLPSPPSPLSSPPFLPPFPLLPSPPLPSLSPLPPFPFPSSPIPQLATELRQRDEVRQAVAMEVCRALWRHLCCIQLHCVCCSAHWLAGLWRGWVRAGRGVVNGYRAICTVAVCGNVTVCMCS